jgi:putative transposase
MSRMRTSPEQIIRHLRQAEVLSSQGRSVSEICRDIEITENTDYRKLPVRRISQWRRRHQLSEAEIIEKFKELENSPHKLASQIGQI